MSFISLTTQIKQEAARLGFALSGVCSASEPEGLERFQKWLKAGYAGQMHYLPDRAAAYEHPRHVLEGVRSVLMLGMHYRSGDPRQVRPGQGRVSRYAWGDGDYHDLIRGRLNRLADFHRQLTPAAKVRGVVDTAPLLEREFAKRAGIGWIGKNTLLIDPLSGSYFFLAALLTDQELQEDAEHATDHCGTCRACLDACPTNAFPEPYVLDATRCISYLTIELRGAIDAGLRGQMDDWLFGCDVCQDVCPWNRHSPLSIEADFSSAEGMNPVDLIELFDLDDEGFRQRFRQTPLWRSKRRGLLRNAAIVLGNQCPPQAVDALSKGLKDSESLIRGASAWALGRYQNDRTRQLLRGRLAEEQDEGIRQEIEDALAESAD